MFHLRWPWIVGAAAVAIGGFFYIRYTAYTDGYTAGQAAWESARVAEVQEALEKAREEAVALREQARAKDQQYAQDVADISRRALTASRRDHVAYGADVVGLLNDAAARANSDIAGATGGLDPNMPARADAYTRWP